MKTLTYLIGFICLVCLLVPSAAFAGKGYMGGKSDVVVAEEEEGPPNDNSDNGGRPDTVEGPLNDYMADSGKLFGDLYRILRQTGVSDDKKLVPVVNSGGAPVLLNNADLMSFTYEGTYVPEGATEGIDYYIAYTPNVQLFVEAVNTDENLDTVVGGEPTLTVVDPNRGSETDKLLSYVDAALPDGVTAYYLPTFSDYGWYAAEIGTITDPADSSIEYIVYGAAQAPYPAQCVQPVANYARWGDISSKSGLTKNRIPMVVTYDPTWLRSECAVGKLNGEVVADPVTGALNIEEVTEEHFIEPCLVPLLDEDGNPVLDEYENPVYTGEITEICKWSDPVNGEVTYPYGVLWTDLVEEVGFGRLNISRSPEVVLQSAFDEAVNNLNSPDTIAIEIDPAGRLLLTKNVYDPILVDKDTGLPLWLGTTKKAIDSPLENVALYVKLLKDGHLVTPGDEREPIDKSLYGGIPLWEMLELEDGPADAALRPTIDIQKLRDWGLGSLVDVAEVDYYTYFMCVDANGAETPCLCWNPDPVQPELDGEWVACDAVADRVLVTLPATAECPVGPNPDNPYVCEGPFTGIMSDDGGLPDSTDLNFAAAFLAGAADKTGEISVDMVVYLNSILGINQVVGTSEDGTVDYEKNPVYFNFRGAESYGEAGRETTFSFFRGQGVEFNQAPLPAGEYNGKVRVLLGASPNWVETVVPIKDATMDGASIFDDIGLDSVTSFPDGKVAVDNILGFTQQSDDDLSVIKFIHTFQIPGLR